MGRKQLLALLTALAGKEGRWERDGIFFSFFFFEMASFKNGGLERVLGELSDRKKNLAFEKVVCVVGGLPGRGWVVRLRRIGEVGVQTPADSWVLG